MSDPTFSRVRLPPAACPPSASRHPPDAWTRQLDLLLESTGEGIFGIDKSGCCTFVNRAACQMLGYAADAVIGRNMHQLIHHTHGDGSHYPEAECPIFNAFRRGLPCRIDSEVLWRADGRSFPAEYSSYPIIDGGVVQGAVVTLLDISERKRSEQLLQEAHEELEQRVAERTAELSRALEQLRALSAHLETVREDERTRIAREIHDELGSLLVALKMDVNWLGARVAPHDELRAKCRGMGRLIDTAVDNVGRIMTDLRPSILDHQGLWAALEWQAQEFFDASGLGANLQVHISHGVAVPEGVQGERWAIAVFRIFQEMLGNVAKHARAHNVRIRLYVDAPPHPVLHLEVQDDGVGALPEALDDRRRHGVMGMRERAAHFGGTLRIAGVPNHGTTVRLTMPLPDAQAGVDAADPTALPHAGAEAWAGSLLAPRGVPQ